MERTPIPSQPLLHSTSTAFHHPQAYETDAWGSMMSYDDWVLFSSFRRIFDGTCINGCDCPPTTSLSDISFHSRLGVKHSSTSLRRTFMEVREIPLPNVIPEKFFEFSYRISPNRSHQWRRQHEALEAKASFYVCDNVQTNCFQLHPPALVLS